MTNFSIVQTAIAYATGFAMIAAVAIGGAL